MEQEDKIKALLALVLIVEGKIIQLRLDSFSMAILLVIKTKVLSQRILRFLNKSILMLSRTKDLLRALH